MASKETIDQLHFRVWLQNQYALKKKARPVFSIRSFAKILDMNQSTLTQLLNGKRKATAKTVKQIENALGTALYKEATTIKGKAQFLLEQDTHFMMVDFRHLAVISLLGIRQGQLDLEWLSEQIGADIDEVEIILDRLTRLKILEKKDNRLRADYRVVELSLSKINVETRQAFFRQIYQVAADKMALPIETTDYSGTFIPTSSKKIAAAKAMLKKFRTDLTDLMNEEESSDQLYLLSVQLFPVNSPQKP